MNELTFKLYSPLTAELLSDENEIWLGNAPIELQGYEMTDYAGAIAAQIAEEGTNIEQYMDAEDNPYLAAHVKSIRLSVEERDGELCGCATVIVDEDLTERGWNDLQDYITGQYSDGWGEGFEQRDIQVKDGILNVHFWQEDHFAFTVEQVVNEPQLEPGAVNTPQQTTACSFHKEVRDHRHCPPRLPGTSPHPRIAAGEGGCAGWYARRFCAERSQSVAGQRRRLAL